MSVQAMAWVFDHSEAEGIDRLVLLVLANHYNHQTGRCDPGYRRISDEARIARGTVGNAVARLVELGELGVAVVGKGHRPSEYYFPWLDAKPPSVHLVDAGSDLASTKTGLASISPPVSVHPGMDRTIKQNQLTAGSEKRVDAAAPKSGVDAPNPPRGARIDKTAHYPECPVCRMSLLACECPKAGTEPARDG